MPMRSVWGALGLGFVLLSGCQKVWGFEDFEEGAGQAGGGSGGTGGGGGTGGSGGSSATGGSSGSGGSAGAEACTHPSAPNGMVGVRVSTNKCVWIDPKEVTRSQYDSFRTGTPTNPTGCEANTSFDGPEEVVAAAPCVGPGQTPDAGAADAAAPPPAGAPVTCVDWCDAEAYCASLGNTLCKGTYNQPKQGPWYDVCSSNGANDYPYVGTFQSNYCNDSSAAVKALVDSGSKTQCVTASGVFDLTGNASEWLDACSGTGPNDSCDTRGGNYNDGASVAACGGSVNVPKKRGLATLGFRCCWEPTT